MASTCIHARFKRCAHMQTQGMVISGIDQGFGGLMGAQDLVAQ
jgi:hypothetical protein